MENEGRSKVLYETKYREESYALQMPMAAPAVRNYASLHFQADAGPSVDQKYEKIGTVAATTAQFEADERRTRIAVNEVRGLIQEEALSSASGFRSLRVTIGVPPGEFDRAIAALQKVARLESFTVTKTDKTNEYLQLRAQRASLEQTRDSLVGLKTQGGQMEERIKLEHEILDLEGKIQGLGVQLGQFDQVNELCTVRFSLTERTSAPVGHPHYAHFLASLAWASTLYLALLASAVVGLLCLVLALVVTQKAKTILAVSEK